MGVSTAAASAAAANRTLTAAVDQLNTAVALQPAFWPALVEKAKLLAAAGDWEQARDTAARVTAAEPTNVSTTTILLLVLAERRLYLQ
jgi:Flp pilus assembly protein TadD